MFRCDTSHRYSVIIIAMQANAYNRLFLPDNYFISPLYEAGLRSVLSSLKSPDHSPKDVSSNAFFAEQLKKQMMDDSLSCNPSPVCGGLFLLLLLHCVEGYLRFIYQTLFSDDLFHARQYFLNAVFGQAVLNG